MKTISARIIFVIAASLALINSNSAEERSTIVELLYSKFLIGELQPNGNVYLEHLALDGGYDNLQKFNGSNYPGELDAYSLSGDISKKYRIALKKVIKDKYIGELENNTNYFSNSFSEPRQDALLYSATYKPRSPVLLVANLDNAIGSVILFSDGAKRVPSEQDRQEALKKVTTDNKFKSENQTTLAKITVENTLLGAKKIALIKPKGTGYNILLSRYLTMGMEYVTNVYVSDFIKNGKVEKTKLKNNSDGPY